MTRTFNIEWTDEDRNISYVGTAYGYRCGKEIEVTKIDIDSYRVAGRQTRNGVPSFVGMETKVDKTALNYRQWCEEQLEQCAEIIDREVNELYAELLRESPHPQLIA